MVRAPQYNVKNNYTEKHPLCVIAMPEIILLKNADELIIGPIELCTASIGLTMIYTVIRPRLLDSIKKVHPLPELNASLIYTCVFLNLCCP